MFKIFLKLLCVTRTRIWILGSRSVKKFIKTEKCKWFRIRTWSGSANHTKLKANASGSGFLNPDSGLFYEDPRFASDPYRTVRIHSSGSNRAPFSCVCEGNRHLDHPWGTGYAMPVAGPNANQVWQDPPNPLAYHTRLPLPFYGNLPWTLPGWKGIHFSPARGFGGLCQDGVWMPG